MSHHCAIDSPPSVAALLRDVSWADRVGVVEIPAVADDAAVGPLDQASPCAGVFMLPGPHAHFLDRAVDGSWSLVRVADWRKDSDGRWLCLICWNVAGRPYGAWFIYDEAFFWMLS